jgi:hypothetical protein
MGKLQSLIQIFAETSYQNLSLTPNPNMAVGTWKQYLSIYTPEILI